jgi:hypothetical protein
MVHHAFHNNIPDYRNNIKPNCENSIYIIPLRKEKVNAIIFTSNGNVNNNGLTQSKAARSISSEFFAAYLHIYNARFMV